MPEEVGRLPALKTMRTFAMNGECSSVGSLLYWVDHGIGPVGSQCHIPPSHNFLKLLRSCNLNFVFFVEFVGVRSKKHCIVHLVLEPRKVKSARNWPCLAPPPGERVGKKTTNTDLTLGKISFQNVGSLEQRFCCQHSSIKDCCCASHCGGKNKFGERALVVSQEYAPPMRHENRTQQALNSFRAMHFVPFLEMSAVES